MIKKEILLVLTSFLIVICTLSAITASEDITTIKETNNLKISSYATNFTDLQSSIDDYDSIELEFNVDETNDEKDKFNNGIIINKAVTIDGKGHTIDANNHGRIFTITNFGSLTLTNIVLANGNATNTLNLNKGGAIFNDGKLTITNSNFTDNHGQFGGAIYINTTSEAIIKDSSFTKNIADDGGAIYNQENSFKIINSEFINNLASSGGAIYNRGTNFTIINSYIIGNKASKVGGAIWNNANGFKIINTQFTNNVVFTNDTTTANGAGAIYSNNFLDIMDSNFTNNTDINNYAIKNDNNIVEFNITNSIFINSRIEAVSSVYQDCELTVLINNKSSFTTVPDVNFNLSAKLIDNKNNSYYGDGLYYSIYHTNGSKEGEPLTADYLFNKVTNLTKSGSYYITAEYKGKCPITSYKIKNSTLNINKLQPTYNVTCELNQGSGGKVTVTLPENAVGMVNITIKNVTYSNNELINGAVVIPVDNLVVGNNSINLIYSGDDRYNSLNENVTINVGKVSEYDVNTSGKLNINTNGGKITIEQPEDLTGNITININNTSYTKQIEKGKHTIFDVDNVYPGKYNVTVITSGDDKYEPLNTIKSVTFDKISDYPHDAIGGSNSTITIILPDDAKGNATITLDNETKTIPINGTTTTQFDNVTPGKYNITVNYTGDDKYNPTVWNQTIKLLKPYSLILYNLTKYCRSSDSLIATLTLDGKAVIGETIEFKLNNRTYSRVTNQYGIASLAINLESGVYDVTATFYDGEDSFSSNATITVLTTIEANNLTKRYKDDNQFYAKFLDFDGTPLSTTEVTFNIHGVFYTRTTNSNGITKLNINLDPGEYILTAINPINNEQKAYTIKVLTSISILSENLVKYYHNATSYQAVFYDYSGNPLVNTNVTFNIHGVFYNKTTDENGVANLAINLDPGFYVITAYNPVTNEQKGNNVTVKPVLIGDDIVVNYGTPIPYEIQVLDGVGTPLEGEVVTMNIHGVIYNKTTNSNGITRLYINLNIGEYVITTTWHDAWASNLITVM